MQNKHGNLVFTTLAFYLFLMCCGFLFVFLSESVFANNLSISNVSLEERDAAAGTVVVKFDIFWENSWRNDINYDAVWVFLKVCKGGSCSPDANVAWMHGMLNTSGTDPADTDPGSNPDLEIKIPEDRVGAFLFRKTKDNGTMSSRGVRLTMNYGEEPLSAVYTEAIQVKVFGIEMVYVTEGDFYIGDGDGTNESTNAFHIGTGNAAVKITNAMTTNIRVDTNDNDDSQIKNTGIGISGSGGLDVTGNGAIDNPFFPTGWNAFYLMKYELTQGQYRDFLNTLTLQQQINRVENSESANYYTMVYSPTVQDRSVIRMPATIVSGALPVRFGCDYAENGFSGDGIFDQEDDGEWIAMNYISWMDLMAYADWAGLRPMTELEFEKAARGPLSPVLGEYAWGTTHLTAAQAPVVNAGSRNEGVSNMGNGLAVYEASNISGPLRTGFAGTDSSNRLKSGAGYYGAMNLSDNLYERAVSVGTSKGRAFRGSHGDGILTTTTSYEGNATNDDWPGIDSISTRGVTGAAGSGFRGGAYDYQSSDMRISDRYWAGLGDDARYVDNGGRLTRTVAESKNYATVLYIARQYGGVFDSGSGARSGGDAICAANIPGNLSSACVNHRIFISVSATDEIRDMPVNYGYRSDLPVYWWHNLNETFTKMANDWDDMFDGSILVSQEAGTGMGTQSSWSGSTSAGALGASYCMTNTPWDSTGHGIVAITGSHSATTGAWLNATIMDCAYSAIYIRCVCQIDEDEI